MIGAGLAWRTVGSESAGYALLEAFSSDDEQVKMLAGISIVKAGDRSVDLIEKARKSGRLTPQVVRLLTDIGGPRSRGLLTQIANDQGPVATAAAESLQVLDQIDAIEDD